jgi:hypothetical protein
MAGQGAEVVPTDRLYTVTAAPSAVVVARMLAVLYPDARTVLDMTYGSGKFWDGSARVAVTGLDLDPARAPNVVGDFRALPFADRSFDVAIFDPPYHTDMGRGKSSIMGARFGTFATLPELEAAVRQGCAEAWRVARLGVIVKCQDYIHASRPVWMSDWVRSALGEPYDFAMQVRPHKITDPKWSRQLSAWRNHATYWAFRKDGNVHRSRGATSEEVVA